MSRIVTVGFTALVLAVGAVSFSSRAATAPQVANTARSTTALPPDGWDNLSQNTALTPTTVTVSIAGLPAGVVPHVFVDNPASGGGFVRSRAVADAVNGTVVISPGEFLEAAPIAVSDAERYMPTRRFQAATGPSLIEFSYKREYLVIVSRWSHGPSDPASVDRVRGTTSTDSTWITANTMFAITATPDAGYVFSHWGVFDPGETADKTRASSRTTQMRIMVDRPLHIVAGFVTR